MTLAEKLRKEGEIRGKIEGLNEAIELGMTLKFPDQVQQVMTAVKKINDLDTLKNIKEAIRTATDVSQVLALVSM